MSTVVQAFDLDILQAGTHLIRLVEDAFHSAVLSVAKVGEGFYAHVYQVSLAKEPKEVIVKCHKYTGRIVMIIISSFAYLWNTDSTDWTDKHGFSPF